MAHIAHLSLVLSLVAGTAYAQETLQETPPELRDFRIEPERPQPAPQSEPEIRPSVVPKTTEEPLSMVPEPVATVSPPPQSPTPSVRQPEVGSVRSDEVREVYEPRASVESEPDADIQQKSPVPPATTSEAPKAREIADGLPFWQLALGFVIAILLAGWLTRRLRRRRHSSEPRPSQKGSEVGAKRVVSMETAPAITQATTIKAANLRPRLALEFIPERATLSFTALTVKGKLHINNAGGGPARNLRMRATMISASNTQARTIDAFYSGAIPIEVNALGDAMAGESLALEIEISIRLNELESHILGTRQIVVPVVVADIAYDWIDGDDVARLACMIGRESQPPQPKMGPLRLDLGPRSFSPLGQRKLYT